MKMLDKLRTKIRLLTQTDYHDFTKETIKVAKEVKKTPMPMVKPMLMPMLLLIFLDDHNSL